MNASLQPAEAIRSVYITGLDGDSKRPGSPFTNAVIVDDMVRDVIGELANMIGGNLKCVLAGGLRLSMPSVVDGPDHSLRVCRAGIRERLVFECVEGEFSVAVLREERKTVRITSPIAV